MEIGERIKEASCLNKMNFKALNQFLKPRLSVALGPAPNQGVIASNTKAAVTHVKTAPTTTRRIGNFTVTGEIYFSFFSATPGYVAPSNSDWHP
ncbi:MAG: hypothetical protein DMF72_16925 [Acidobacteria bacterium]|nr:MAG: hypothetical protein DMF72_16925 [Acidobacteriota bacterium]